MSVANKSSVKDALFSDVTRCSLVEVSDVTKRSTAFIIRVED
jgi:hypothetical protein